MYGALIFIVSLVIAILYGVAFFAPWLVLPFCWHEWAVDLPVLLFVMAMLVICAEEEAEHAADAMVGTKS